MTQKITHTGLVAIMTASNTAHSTTSLFFLLADPADPSIAAKAWHKENRPRGSEVAVYLPMPESTITVTRPHVETDPDFLTPYINAIKAADSATIDVAITKYQGAKQLTIDPVISTFEEFAKTNIAMAISRLNISAVSAPPSMEDLDKQIAKTMQLFPYLTISLLTTNHIDEDSWKEFE